MRRELIEAQGTATRENLDNMLCPCGTPAREQPVMLMAKCHSKIRLVAWYYDGVLKLLCPVCRKVVLAAQIARDNEGCDGNNLCRS